MKIKNYLKSRKIVFKVSNLIWPRLEPSFFIIGTQKGGTTSLFNYLIQHPDILSPHHKEMRFFDKYFDYGFDWYNYYYPKFQKGKITGEASPEYLYNIHTPQRMHQAYPGAKIIVMLRNPIDRAFSNYNMIKSWGEEPLSFEEAIETEIERTKEEKQQLLAGTPLRFLYKVMHYTYADRGFYSKQLKHWFKYFDKSQFYFIRSEDFFADPKQQTAFVLDFLDLNRSDSILDAIKFKVANKGTYQSELGDQVRESLTELYQTEEEELDKLLGIKFNWFNSDS